MSAQQEWYEKDYYKILGVAKSSSAKEITKAYRKLAKEHHPDANRGSDDKFKEISAAYDVIGDPGKRKEYDEVRQSIVSGRSQSQAGGFNGFGNQQEGFPGGFNFGDSGDINDIFGSMFGNTRRGPRRGQDLEASINLTFRDSVKGVTRDLILGENKNTKVRIPPGVEEGQRIRISGKGGAGEPGAANGDLYIICHIDTDSRFGRSGRNVTTQAMVSFAEAALGSQITVPTLDNPVTLKVPAGTQPGATLRVKGRGVSASNKYKDGDLLVKIKVIIPKVLSQKEKEALGIFLDAPMGSI